jgi:superfamily II DNA or RNA helicase
MSSLLHAAFLNRRLLLWSQAADASTLQELLRETLAGLKVTTWERVGAMAWLPSKAPGSRGRTAREPAEIEALALEARDAIAFLSECAGREMLGAHIAVGRDLAFWCRALRLGAEIVIAQRFLPSIAYDETERTYRAVWEPVLGDRERQLSVQLASAMPEVCRAITIARKQAPSATPGEVLKAFLAASVDGLVRTSAAPPYVLANGSLTLHDRWVLALRADDARLLATANELHGFAAHIESWRSAVLDQHASEYRLCLRVEEPEDNADLWRIVYLLQSRSDPSLLIDVKAAKEAAGSWRGLLAAIGYAAKLSPAIEASLRQNELPWGFSLQTAHVYEFLSQTAWQLEQSGVGVILPAWWLGKDTKTRLTARARVKRPTMRGGGGLRADTLLDVDWSIAIGDQTLTQPELQRLAKLKMPLVNIRGQWVHVDGDELRSALERAKRGTRMAMAEIVRMQLESPASIAATGSVRTFLEQLRGERSFEDLPIPTDLRAVLRPYQARGYSWLRFFTQAGLGACLADDMGLGKTIQTLSLVLRDWHEDGKQPVLLVCPTSVIGNWLREAQRFAPTLPVHVHHGSDRARGVQFARKAKRHAIVVTSYALLHRDLDIFQEVRWRGVVLDEAQNVKNTDSKQARAARSLQAGYRIALTGTPIENHVGDLWAIMEFLNPGMLGSQASFKREFFIPIQALGDREAAARLKRVSGPFVLRRLKSDPNIISDLPPKNEMKVFCTLTREQASLYAAVLRDFEHSLNDSDGMQRRGTILSALSKLKQVCNHPAHFAKDNSPLSQRSGKLARLEEMLEEVLDAGECALIFTQFAEMGELMQRRLRERFAREVLFLHGGVPKAKRDEMVERFSNDHGPSLFVLSLKAGGSGLNLTRANHVFHFDRWWNPAVENQATDRAFRIGQTKSVQVHKFICAGTLEEKIDALIENKRAVSDQVVGTGEAWLTELSSAQLRELVALAPDAVED